MNWKHVQLIFQREMTDQLRDRRTLFTITVLPILLYPLIGMLMMQVAQFKRESAVDIQVVGLEHWPEDLPLLEKDGSLVAELGGAEFGKLITFQDEPWPDTNSADSDLEQQARTVLTAGAVDAVLLIEPRFSQGLEARLQAAKVPVEPEGNATAEASPNPADGTEKSIDAAAVPAYDGLRLFANLASDRSQVAQRRLREVLDRWGQQWAAEQLATVGVNPRILQPIRPEHIDTAPPDVRRAVLWSKVLPFVMLVWALTGAFYPAIDLCAGEKERGTLETLLSSPARRREIVWGKLGAISVFSVGSALLNLMSMHITAGIIVKQFAAQGSPELAQSLGPMPFHAFGWLVLLLLPMSAFFSALALAVAALARSTKEGQYYLMPLLLVTLPLVALPMIPSMELNLGTSLVPVSGAVFLVRSLIEGQYSEAVVHLPIVLIVTALCCWVAVRWAIRQFESESVMFAESERWNLRLWVHHLWRDREETASPAEAILCGVIILIGMFFAQFLAGSSISGWGAIVKSTVVVQIGLILTPCLLMSIFLTRSISQALRIHRVQPSHLLAATALGICLHPSYMLLGRGIQQLYQISDEMALVMEYFQGIVTAQPLWTVLLLLAVMPAVCEELAFRGFIFGGLLRQQGVLRAIVVSALFFGFTHSLLQQSIAASLMGVVLGFIAWRTGGVVCTIIVHVINNTLSLSLAWCGANAVSVPRGVAWAISAEDGAWAYNAPWVTMSVMLSLALFLVLARQNRQTHDLAQAELA